MIWPFMAARASQWHFHKFSTSVHTHQCDIIDIILLFIGLYLGSSRKICKMIDSFYTCINRWIKSITCKYISTVLNCRSSVSEFKLNDSVIVMHDWTQLDSVDNSRHWQYWTGIYYITMYLYQRGLTCAVVNNSKIFLYYIIECILWTIIDFLVL